MSLILYTRPSKPSGEVIHTKHAGQGLTSRQFSGAFEVYPIRSRLLVSIQLRRLRALEVWHKLVLELASYTPPTAPSVVRLHAKFRLLTTNFLDAYRGQTRKKAPYGLAPVPVAIPFCGDNLHPLNILLDPQAYVTCSEIRDAYIHAPLEALDVLPLAYTDDEAANAIARARSDEQDALAGYISKTITPYLQDRAGTIQQVSKDSKPLSGPDAETTYNAEFALLTGDSNLDDPTPYISYLSEVKTVAVQHGAKWSKYKPPVKNPRGRRKKGSITLKDEIRVLFDHVKLHGISKGNAQHIYDRAAILYQQTASHVKLWNAKHGTHIKAVNRSTQAYRARANIEAAIKDREQE